MHTLSKGLLVVGLGTAIVAFGAPVPSAKAQGLYIDAPGVHVGVGKRHHHRYYRRYYDGYGAYAADPGHPYGYYHNYGDPRCGIPNHTIQDGVCKPYRGF